TEAGIDHAIDLTSRAGCVEEAICRAHDLLVEVGQDLAAQPLATSRGCASDPSAATRLITSCTCPRSPAGDSPLVARTDFTHATPNLRSTLSQIEQVTAVEALDAKIADLEQQATAQDPWDDVDNAQQVTSALSHAQSERRRITELTQRIDDL